MLFGGLRGISGTTARTDFTYCGPPFSLSLSFSLGKQEENDKKKIPSSVRLLLSQRTVYYVRLFEDMVQLSIKW